MNARTLLDNFDLIADAPGGVPKLRELILQLAVRGKLVPQDPKDEPARFLVDRMFATRMKRIKDGDIRDSEHLPPIKHGELPYVIPAGWEWIRIGSAINMVNGKAFKPNEWSTSGLPIVRIQNLNNSNAPFNYCDFEVPEKVHIRDGDFLISWSGTPGTSFGAFIWQGGHAVLNQHIFRCELYGGFLDQYLRHAVNAQLDEMISRAHGGVGLRHITKGKLEHMLITLPPLPEQKRIVAKVDELMKRCDELEARQKDRAARHKTLVASCLNAVHARRSLGEGGTDPKKPNPNFIIHNSSFNLLFSSPESIAELRKTILKLAVLGRLVPPHAGRAAKSGEQELLPVGWAWKTIGELQPEFQNGLSKRVGQTGQLTPVLRLANIVNDAISLADVREIMMTGNERKKYELLQSDILITRVNGSVDLVGSFTQVAMKIDAAYCDHFIRMRLPADNILPEYAVLYGKSSLCREAVAKLFITTAGQKTVNQGHISSLQVPLPPLAEQKRIVAKVNELMTLCDALEAKLTQSRADADTLAATLVRAIGCDSQNGK